MLCHRGGVSVVQEQVWWSSSLDWVYLCDRGLSEDSAAVYLSAYSLKIGIGPQLLLNSVQEGLAYRYYWIGNEGNTYSQLPYHQGSAFKLDDRNKHLSLRITVGTKLPLQDCVLIPIVFGNQPELRPSNVPRQRHELIDWGKLIELLRCDVVGPVALGERPCHQILANSLQRLDPLYWLQKQMVHLCLPGGRVPSYKETHVWNSRSFGVW
mmetsp:Transcript_17160/g.47892  ORF Transcript_17160/g.47892 Transcript_17160/m.47892 type:complete len:210 (+) Transcript_17160:202-831(+)